MKKRLLALLIGLIGAGEIQAEFVTLVSTNNEYSAPLVLGTNEMATIVTSHINDGADNPVVEYDFGIFKTYSYFASGNSISNVVGPVTIRVVQNRISAKCVVGFEVKRATAPSQSSSAVVIPDDNGAPVQIILESSTDLVNWTAAAPGTYGTSTQRRFFRLRAQR